MFGNDSGLINEGIIPMNYNFNIAKQNIANNNINTLNPTQQKTINDRIQKDLVKSVLQELNININNLVIGNQKPNFNKMDAKILYNSICNKCNEILNARLHDIDNKIILELTDLYIKLFSNQFDMQVIRDNMTLIDNYIYYSSNTNIIAVNPNMLNEIIHNWVNMHPTHQMQTDTQIFD